MSSKTINSGFNNIRFHLTKGFNPSYNESVVLQSGNRIAVKHNSNDVIFSSSDLFTPQEIMSAITSYSGNLEFDHERLSIKSFDYVLEAKTNNNPAEYLEFFISGSGISFERSDENKTSVFSRYGHQIATIKAESDRLTISQHYSGKNTGRWHVEELCSESGISRCAHNLYRLMDRRLLKSSANNNIQNIRTKTDLQRMLIARFLQSRPLRESMLLEIEQKYRDGEITDGSIVRLREMLRSVPNEDAKLSELHSIKAAILSKVSSTKLVTEFQSLDASPCPIPSHSGIEPQQPDRIIHFA
jgi:hypothetical protein